MRIIHLADLHIGKRINDYSMIEDQKYVLNQIIEVINNKEASVVIIAGDVYDKGVPSAEAVALFDEFLTKLARLGVITFIISGNHDCPERLSFGARIMEQQNVYIAPAFNGRITPVTIKNGDNSVDFYMLPFIKPATVRRFFPDVEIHTYTEAVETVLKNTSINKERINILIAHQFVTGAQRCDSEEVSVGGLDNVDYEVFDDFDYVALGHIHGPQRVGRDTVRYCGTPLKYSFSEINHKKSITVINIDENAIKGEATSLLETGMTIDKIPIEPLHEMRHIKGTYEQLTLRENYVYTDTEDYMHITLTDEEDIPDAIGKLRSIYPNIMKLDYDNKRTRMNQSVEVSEGIKNKSPLEMFEEFYFTQNNKNMIEEQLEFTQSLIEKIWND